MALEENQQFVTDGVIVLMYKQDGRKRKLFGAVNIIQNGNSIQCNLVRKTMLLHCYNH